MTNKEYNNIVNEMIYTALNYQTRNELINIQLAPVWLVKDKQNRETAQDVINNLITNAAINIVDNNFIVPDDTFISALNDYLLPLPSATKALEAIRRALEEADVLGYYQTDLDIIADAINNK